MQKEAADGLALTVNSEHKTWHVLAGGEDRQWAGRGIKGDQVLKGTDDHSASVYTN